MSNNASSSGVENYLAVGPTKAEIDPALLQTWCESSADTRDPFELYHLGWMRFELSGSRDKQAYTTGQDVDTDSQVAPMECFKRLQEMPAAPRSLKTLARIAVSSIPLHLDSFLGPIEEKAQPGVRGVFNNDPQKLYEKDLGQISARMLNLQRFDAEEVNVINLLCVMQLVNTEGTLLTLPAPSRFSFPPDSPRASNLVLWDYRNTGETDRLRVGTMHSSEYITLSPDVLNHAGYPGRQGFGTLQALADCWQSHKKARALAFLEPVQRTVVDSLLGDLRKRQREQITISSTDFAFAEWYHQLPPQDNPVLTDKARIDQAIAALELKDLLPPGELTEKQRIGPRECLTLAWLYYEYATSDLGDEALVNEYFDRAIKTLLKGRNLAQQQGDYTAQYLAIFDRQTIALQQAIHNQTITDEFLGSHARSLATVAEAMFRPRTDEAGETSSHYDNMLNELETADPHTYKRVCNLLFSLTVCLVAAAERQGVLLAGFGSPRQQGTFDRPGWDCNLWPLLQRQKTGKFSLPSYGRLRFTEGVASAALPNVVDLPLRDMGYIDPEQGFDAIMVAIKNAKEGPESLTPSETALLGRILDTLDDATRYVGLL